MQGSLSIERMCQLANVSRAGFYRSLQEREPAEENMQVRSAIQEIFTEHKAMTLSGVIRRGDCRERWN